MAVKIRLARFGCRNRPFFRIVIADSKAVRDGKKLQVVGFYDPLAGKDDPKRVGIKFDSIEHWLSMGAQPSDPLKRILLNAGVIQPPPMVITQSRRGPSASSMPSVE